MKRNMFKGSILLFLLFSSFFTFVFVSYFATITKAAGGRIIIRVQYQDGYPRSGADVRKSWPLPYQALGTTNASGWMDISNPGLSEGDYKVQAWWGGSQFGPNTSMHVDGNGNGGATIIKNTEITPPAIQVLSPQNMTYISSSVPLTFTIYDYSSISWIGYSLDGQANVTVTGNTTLSSLSHGHHNVVVYANDTFGNMGASNKIFFSIAIIVPDDYATIQEAINHASNGDTIFVKSGTYHEHQIVVNKAVNILGESRSSTFLDDTPASGTHIFYVTSDNVVISGFTFCYSGAISVAAAIEATHTTGLQVMDNLFASHACGIEGGAVTRAKIMLNVFVGQSSGAVHFDHCFDGLIEDNILSSAYYGIWLSGESSNFTVRTNTITSCKWEALDLMGVSNNTFCCNNIVGNAQSVWFTGTCSRNVFYHNNFIDNGAVVGNSTSIWDDGYPSGGNYWSDYTNADLYSGPYQNETGSDGIGDMPYVFDENNRDGYPLMKSYPWSSHDVGITSVITSKTIVGQEDNVSISAMMFNYGNYTESVNITIYADTTIIGEIKNIGIASRNFTTISFTWNTNGFAGNYIISAYAEPVTGETDTADNRFVDGIVNIIPLLMKGPYYTWYGIEYWIVEIIEGKAARVVSNYY